MFRQYLFVFSTLFLSIHCVAANNDWEQAKHQLRTSVEFVHNSNLYFQPAPAVADEKAAAMLQYNWLGLFEGYGLALPVSIKSGRYADESVLNSTDYQLSPALKLFLSDAADLTVQSHWQRELLLAGSGKAEFLDVSQKSLTDEQKLLQLSLQLGRAPDKQNLKLSVGRMLNEQHSQTQQLTAQQANFLKTDYGHRLNENTSLLLNAEMRREQQDQTPSELQQLGAGWSSRVGGSQQFQLIAGRFWRNTAQQQSSGSYWQVQNLSKLSQQWQLELLTSRNSVLSYATDSVSQLDTRHSASLAYQWNDAHQISLILARNLAKLDQQQLQRRRLELAFDWHWQLSTSWQQQLKLQRAKIEQRPEADKVATEVFWQVSRLW